MPAYRIALLFLAFGHSLLTGCNPAPAENPPLANSSLRGEYSLVDSSGKPVRAQDFAGKWQMVYFGYTWCPDICPLDMREMVRGHNLFVEEHPEFADRLVPIFITVDPARDTPAKVGEYAAAFSDKAVGLTGTQEQVDSAIEAMSVFAEAQGADDDGNYLVDHSRNAYLLDQNANPIALLPVDESGAAVAKELEKWVH